MLPQTDRLSLFRNSRGPCRPCCRGAPCGCPLDRRERRLPRAASAERICGGRRRLPESLRRVPTKNPFDKLASTSLREAEQRRSLTALPSARLGKVSKVEP